MLIAEGKYRKMSLQIELFYDREKFQNVHIVIQWMQNTTSRILDLVHKKGNLLIILMIIETVTL